MSKTLYEDGVDIYFNALLSGNPAAMPACIATLKGMGLTDRQLEQIRALAEKKGLSPPKETKVLKEICFKWDPKFDSLEDKNKFQNVADQYLTFIYGLKFNNGVHGAFGTAQKIKTNAYDHAITLVLPKVYQLPLDGEGLEAVYAQTKLTRRLRSSIEHYLNVGNGRVILTYE